MRISRGVGYQAQDKRDAMPYALRRQRQARIGILDCEGCVVGNRAGVNARVHPVQRHRVCRLSLVDRPARRIQPCEPRQRAWVQIKTADPCSVNDVGAEHDKRVDVEEKIHVEVADQLGER
jgi:hypothetical protein